MACNKEGILYHCPLIVSNGRNLYIQLECGPMPNVMVTLLIIGGALCSTLRSLADAHYLTAVQ